MSHEAMPSTAAAPAIATSPMRPGYAVPIVIWHDSGGGLDRDTLRRDLVRYGLIAETVAAVHVIGGPNNDEDIGDFEVYDHEPEMETGAGMELTITTYADPVATVRVSWGYFGADMPEGMNA